VALIRTDVLEDRIASIHTSRCLYKSLLLRSVPARTRNPEDGGDTIIRNVGSYKSHTASPPRR
jgi:hypothetical protein